MIKKVKVKILFDQQHILSVVARQPAKMSGQNGKTRLEIHSGKGSKCAICLKVFSSSANLNTHVVLKHAEVEESNYKCSDCKKGFIRLCDLNNHKQGHKGSLRRLNKPFKCKICSRPFVSIKKLQDHQEIHTEKPFVCQSCVFRTYSNGLLQIHAKIHRQELSFSCSLCDKRFRHKISHVVHERIHKGEKTYGLQV